MKKLIINLAPTGMIPTKKMTPHVPVTPSEIIDCVLQCAPFGVSMVHLHARDEHEKPTYHKDAYAKIIYGIRSHFPDMIIVVSTSGRDFKEFEKRSEVLELRGDDKPDMASLTLSSMNFVNTASTNSPEMVMKLAEKMLNNDIKPELEVFDFGMANYAHYLIKKELIKPPYYFNLFMGNIATVQPNLSHVGLLVSDLPKDSVYCFAGIGNCQKEMNALGILVADGMRVGLEDHIWYDEDRTTLASNPVLVERMQRLALAYEREIATSNEVRKLLWK